MEAKGVADAEAVGMEDGAEAAVVGAATKPVAAVGAVTNMAVVGGEVVVVGMATTARAEDTVASTLVR